MNVQTRLQTALVSPAQRRGPVAYASAKSCSFVKRFQGAWSRLSLALQFAAAASVVLVIGMTILGFWVSFRIENGVVQNSAITTAFYMDSLIEPLLQSLANQKTLPPETVQALDKVMNDTPLGRTIAAIKIWGPDGVILYSNEKELIGRSFPQTRGFQQAIHGQIEAEFGDLDEDENVIDKEMGQPLLEVYSPVHESSTNRVIGVAEMYQFGADLRANINKARRSTILLVGSFTLVMLVVLSNIVRRGSKTIVRQRLLLEQRVDHLARLLEQNEELRKNIVSARKRTADTNERLMRRIGADLHDGPAQLIGLALLLLDGLNPKDELKDNTSRAEIFEAIRGVLKDSLAEIRNLSAGIAPPELENVTLTEAIQLAARNHEKRTGTQVDCRIADLPDEIPSSIKTAAYRFTQEGLNNAFRHAGGAGQTVVASSADDRIDIEVIDSGPGMAPNFKPATTALGLAGLRDRIESLGGQFEIETKPGSGTRLISHFIVSKDTPAHV